MNRLSPVIAAILLFVAAAFGTTLPLPARAAESYDNCTGFIDTLPATITTPGTWCLRQNLSTAITSGAAIRIDNNDVTLDCNHFTIDGGGDPEPHPYGVYAGDRFNVSIRNCSVRGFATGIMLVANSSGGDYLVERNTLTWNARRGIVVGGAGSSIRGNRVLNTGGAHYLLRGDAYGITAMDGVDVIDNTVNGVHTFYEPRIESVGYGIQTIDNGAGSVVGNRIRGLGGPDIPYGVAYGIYNVNSRGLIIRDNDIQGPSASVTRAVGLRCSSTPATARDNVIAGFATAIQKCMSIGNTVNTY